MVPSSVTSSAGSPRAASARSESSRATATQSACVEAASELSAVTSPPAPLTSRSGVSRYTSAGTSSSGARLATTIGWTLPSMSCR